MYIVGWELGCVNTRTKTTNDKAQRSKRDDLRASKAPPKGRRWRHKVGRQPSVSHEREYRPCVYSIVNYDMSISMHRAWLCLMWEVKRHRQTDSVHIVFCCKSRSDVSTLTQLWLYQTRRAELSLEEPICTNVRPHDA